MICHTALAYGASVASGAKQSPRQQHVAASLVPSDSEGASEAISP
jgi:hypothetical protein